MGGSGLASWLSAAQASPANPRPTNTAISIHLSVFFIRSPFFIAPQPDPLQQFWHSCFAQGGPTHYELAFKPVCDRLPVNVFEKRLDIIGPFQARNRA